jgi:hypothetical protein
VFDGAEYTDILAPFADQATAADINNHGEIVGTFTNGDFANDAHGFFFSDGRYQRFDFPDATTTHFVGLNNSRNLAGYFTTDRLNAGFLVKGRDLLQITGTAITQVTGVNDEGMVSGYFLTGNSVEEAWHQSFVFDANEEEFAEADVSLPGPKCTFSLTEPIDHCIRIITGINAAGTLAGYFDNDDGVYRGFVGSLSGPPLLQPGDADRDLDFDQLDLVRVLANGKYLTGEAATWGEGDWEGGPGGSPGNPPAGDGLFDQDDIIAASATGHYGTGTYAAASSFPDTGAERFVVARYDARTGDLAVSAPVELSLNALRLDSAGGLFLPNGHSQLTGPFDVEDRHHLFKATFGGSFNSLHFPNVLPRELTRTQLQTDLSIDGSFAAGGRIIKTKFVVIPEPPTRSMLVAVGVGAFAFCLSARSRFAQTRFSAKCDEQMCMHYDGSKCRLASRVVRMLPAVADVLPACSIRPTCRAWTRGRDV